ncbi:MAG: methyltransferase domain-containing protein [Clostridiales bacterium]|nr:methyltransferase domain-containing protein [Clostridiales bacterium]
MSFAWTPERVRFMANADAHTDYYQKLARWLAPWLPKNGHVCDAGCGLGSLSLALLPYVQEVTAVDRSPLALAELRAKKQENNRNTLEILQGDIASLPPRIPYDAMVFCFFGAMSEILPIAKAQCRGQLFILKKNYLTHRFSAGNIPIEGDRFDRSKALLAKLGIPFEAEEQSLELGQPLASLEEARQFFTLYSRDKASSVFTDAYLKSRLVPGHIPDFPWYLPQEKKVGLIRLHTRDIPENIEDILVKGETE